MALTLQSTGLVGTRRIARTQLRNGAGKPLLCNHAQRPVARRGSVKVEANLFSRVGRIFKSYANSVVESAEDPEKILDQAVSDMNADLIKLRQATAKIIASKKQIEAKYKQCLESVDQWTSRAELAVKAGQDDLAREALKKRKAFEDQAKTWKVQLEQQEKAQDQLLSNTREMESKLQEAKSKKETLKARAASAKSSKQIQELVSGLDTSSSFAAFDKMEEKVVALEAEAESTTLLTGSDSLEGKFKQLEGNNVDDELSRMKKQISSSSTAGPSSSSSTATESRPKVKDAIDMELEALRKKVKE
eukprot:TRINITY_DN2501_c0_g1_i6.p1 TRINITY_DN2501_c0_g1~~TRINITY_DN2501_c0_g1_i6.p1  ORF type:complete len:326 (+),score=49.82 TRINITY_DN2501_c0_g1_i6:68-979(+)